MSTLVIFYSYSGSTRAQATQLAQQLGATLKEVRDVRRPSIIGAFLRCPAAIGQKPGKIQPIQADLAAYDRIIIMGPIWASHPAPPVNSIIAALPPGKAVELRLVSSGGESQKDKVVALVEKHGCTVADYQNVRSVAG